MTIIVIEKQASAIAVNKPVVKRVRIIPYNIPSGITVDTLTEAGSMLVALNSGYVTETGAPTADGLVWTSNLSLPKKGEWKAPGGGGGDVEMTNKSGAAQEAGTVVINDYSNDAAFTVTTTESDRRVVGVLSEEIANNATGKVAILGKKTVKVVGNVSRGHWLVASSTQGRAKSAGGYIRPAGAVGMAMTSYAGGGNGTVTALVYVDIYLGASAGKGYVLGGYTSTYVNNGQVLSYASQTTSAQASANLSTARYGLAGVSGIIAGYAMGGTTGSNVATADKVVYSTDTTSAQASANLSLARNASAGVGGDSAGYAMGGVTASAVATTDKVVYSTDTTAVQASANLSASRYGAAGVSGLSAGYAMGGGVSAVATTDKVVYSTDTTVAQASANLSVSRYYVTGLAGNLMGYAMGGTTGSVSAVADGVTISTDITAAVATANLIVASYGHAGIFANV